MLSAYVAAVSAMLLSLFFFFFFSTAADCRGFSREKKKVKNYKMFPSAHATQPAEMPTRNAINATKFVSPAPLEFQFYYGRKWQHILLSPIMLLIDLPRLIISI